MAMTNIIRLVKNIKVEGKPEGWVVRELYSEEKQRTVMMDFGIYVSEDRFVSVPITYSLKSKFIPMMSSYGDAFKYYTVPADVSFGISSFVNKKGIKLPLLVEPTEKHPAALISCFAYTSPIAEQIIDVKFGREDSVSLRDFIAKDRSVMAVIMMDTNTSVINPSIQLKLDTGFLKSHTENHINVDFENSSYHLNEDTETLENEVNTRFIKLPRYQITDAPVKNKPNNTNENNNRRRPNNKKRYNNKYQNNSRNNNSNQIRTRSNNKYDHDIPVNKNESQ